MVAERRERLIVFAKSVCPGAVKTRLIPLLGAEGAARLHVCLVRRTLDAAAAWRPGAIELHTDDVADERIRDCARSVGANLLPQSGGDLGNRMLDAFEQALQTDGCSAVVLIGSDCPALSAAYIARAFEALREHDAVFGPAEDGGYVLIGLKRVAAEIFRAMPWSSSNVMAETRGRLSQLGWRWAELDTLWDVDAPRDYERLTRGNGTAADDGVKS